MSKDALQHTPTIEQVLASVLETNAKLVARLEAIESGNTAEAAHKRMKDSMRPLAEAPEVIKGCLCPDTSCTFDAEIQHGKVFRLIDLKLPDGHTKHIKHGGMVPDSIQIFQDKQAVHMAKNEHGLDESIILDQSALTRAYKDWRLMTFLQPVRLRYVGKPFPEYLRPKPSKAA